MSEVKVNKISPRSGTDVQLGDSGDTITVPSGATFDASNATTTLPSTVVTTDGSQTLTNKTIDASQLVDASLGLAKLSATGTKDATTFLRGDNTFAEPAGGGITMADQWRLTANTNTGTNADVTTNWERVDNTGWSGIGTGLTESSGIFSFPQTGIYKIDFIGVLTQDDADGNAEYFLYITTDNSSYTGVSIQQGGNTGTAVANNTMSNSFLFDVTNTTTHKFKFRTNSFSSSTVLKGDTDISVTGFTVIRLGDT